MAAQVCDAMEGAVLGLQEGAMGAAEVLRWILYQKRISKGFFEQRIHKKKHCLHLFTMDPKIHNHVHLLSFVYICLPWLLLFFNGIVGYCWIFLSQLRQENFHGLPGDELMLRVMEPACCEASNGVA
jgi:hypothetical protein